ncbi:ATP-dependent Clp protease adaptor protein ClpS [Goodfellowiella coeruleoviolacea]|uniref:ATP-dependent Clp protease adaptor protein ClpS n=1 Tax=Goodfellowiella coeruleoviolacea TaxID=334858 RepID=A0AAE3KML7_9PSEU|nr:ATP-dependent Clp protease adaptor protein ClpS [Goodfellowiella coeruleoviolacea]
MLDDDVNTMVTVTYLLRHVAGLSPDDAAWTMLRVHEQGSAEVARFAELAEAEQLAVRLQSFGLHGLVWGSS